MEFPLSRIDFRFLFPDKGTSGGIPAGVAVVPPPLPSQQTVLELGSTSLRSVHSEFPDSSLPF